MNLRNTRLDRRLTQPQVVAKMKEVEPRVDVALYSKMESGICLPTPAQMGVLLSALDCQLYDLYTIDEIAFPSIQPEVIEIPEETRVPVRPRKPDRRKGGRHRKTRRICLRVDNATAAALPKICDYFGYKNVQAWQQDCLDTLIHNYQPTRDSSTTADCARRSRLRPLLQEPPRAACAAVARWPGRVDLPDVLRRPRDGRQQMQNEMPEMWAEIEVKRHDII